MRQVLLFSLALACCGSPERRVENEVDQCYNDSLFAKRIESIRSGRNDSIRPDSFYYYVDGMITLTSIEPAGAKSLIGVVAINDSDLLNWSQWYIQNRCP